ncbi:MAG: ECF transporter S component [Eggerthellaceae bacterium]|jgi:energy-coupling factor transport system substrate-specific component
MHSKLAHKDRGEKIAGIVETCVLVGVLVILVLCAVFSFEQTLVVTLVVVLACIAFFFIGFDRRNPRPRDFMPIAVLAALAAAGRILFAPFPSFKPVSAIAIIAGAAFGRRSGFMVGALAALVSNFFFGQGMWSPWQMYAWGLIGYIGGVLAERGLFDHEAVLLIYGGLSGLLFGFILNSWSIVGFFHPQTVLEFFAVYAAALPFDLIHGAATVIFLKLLYGWWMPKLDRIKRKYALMDGE